MKPQNEQVGTIDVSITVEKVKGEDADGDDDDLSIESEE
jgi:hypothetical protein